VAFWLPIFAAFHCFRGLDADPCRSQFSCFGNHRQVDVLVEQITSCHPFWVESNGFESTWRCRQVENERVQMNDVSADTESAVVKGAAVRNLRGAFQGASAGGAAKVQQLGHALSWRSLVAQQLAPNGRCKTWKAVRGFDTSVLVWKIKNLLRNSPNPLRPRHSGASTTSPATPVAV
jgi:hypothetical protein